MVASAETETNLPDPARASTRIWPRVFSIRWIARRPASVRMESSPMASTIRWTAFFVSRVPSGRTKPASMSLGWMVANSSPTQVSNSSTRSASVIKPQALIKWRAKWARTCAASFPRYFLSFS